MYCYTRICNFNIQVKINNSVFNEYENVSKIDDNREN